MTKTDITLSTMQSDIKHLVEVSEDGWQLAWGESTAGPPKRFELLCKGANALQVKNLEKLINAAYDKACHELN
jgi:hypothetical protein